MKQFKHHKDLIKQAVKNTLILTPEEQLLRNVLRLNGIKNIVVSVQINTIKNLD